MTKLDEAPCGILIILTIITSSLSNRKAMILTMMTHKTSMMTIVNIGKVVAMGEDENDNRI